MRRLIVGIRKKKGLVLAAKNFKEAMELMCKKLSLGIKFVFFFVLFSCPLSAENVIKSSFFADTLLWTVREPGADCWAEEIETEGVILVDRFNQLKEVHFPWNIGFRLGAIFTYCASPFDSLVNYTRFHTTGSDQVNGAPGTVHSTFLGNFYVNNKDGSGLSGPSYEKAEIKWTIDFNIFDLSIGWNGSLTKTFKVHPFLGLKGGWINQSIESTWENPETDGPDFFNIGYENLKNDYWCLGIQVGVDTKWQLFCCHECKFSLFSDLSGALLFSHWSFYDTFTTDTQNQVIVHLDDISSGSSMVRTFMGFLFEGPFLNEGLIVSAKLGFEMQIFLDQLKYYSFTGGRLDNQLSLQGGTFEFNIKF